MRVANCVQTSLVSRAMLLGCHAQPRDANSERLRSRGRRRFSREAEWLDTVVVLAVRRLTDTSALKTRATEVAAVQAYPTLPLHSLEHPVR